MRKLISICILLVSINAIAKDYIFERHSSLDGLSQNLVLDVFQDSEGYVWLGTFDGLNRYDGYDYEIFKPSEEEGSISGSQIIWIEEDNKGNIWVASLDGGVCMYNKETGKFTNYHNTEDNPDQFLSNDTRVVFPDSRGNIWIATLSGLNVLQPNDAGEYTVHTFTRDEENPNSLHQNTVLFIWEDSQQRVWITTENSVSIWNDHDDGEIHNDFHKVLTMPSNRGFRELDEIEGGYLLSFAQGIYFFRLNEDDYSIMDSSRFEEHISFYFEIDLEGNVWSAGYNGLFLFEPQMGDQGKYRMIDHFTVREDVNTINNDFIRNMHMDKAGILWLGTHGSGFLKCNTRKTTFRHYRSSYDEGSLPADKTWTFYEDNMQNLWIGTEGGGLSLLRAEKNRDYASGFESFPVCPEGQQNFLFQMVNISDTETPSFVGGVGYNQCLVRMEPNADGTAWNWRRIIPEVPSMTMVVMEDNNGMIWGGTYEGGLFKFDPDDESSAIIYNTDNSSIPTNIIRSITEDTKGRLWIGTDRGLMLMTPEQKALSALEYTLFLNSAVDSLSISHNYTVPVLETTQGEIYIGTFGGGLNLYHEGDALNNGTFTSIQEKDGLPNNTIKSLQEDDEGSLWIGSNRGLTRLSKNRKKMRNFDTHDGLQDMEFTDLSSYRRNDGEMLFGGIKGFNAFYPHEISEDTIKPNVVFSGIEVMNKPIGIGQEVNGHVILPKHINYLDELELKYSENSITFYFAAIHYALPSGNLYQYMLEGFDEDWIRTTSVSRFARYTNIEPGEYTFKVLGGNSHGIWDDEAKSIRIIIEPPYWQTWWFRILVFLILAGIGYYFVRRQREKEKRERAILQEKIDESMKQLEGSKREIEEAKAEVEGAKEALRQKELEEAEMRFFNRGLAKFSEILGQHDELNKLCHSVIAELAEYIGAQLGVIYLINEKTHDDEEEVLRIHGSYGGGIAEEDNVQIAIGQGNIGTCFKTGEVITLSELPDDYIKISSGLGEVIPHFISMIPLMQNEEKIGVIEVASFEKIEEYKINFIKKLGENISSTILLMRAMGKNNLIIEEAQAQAEELRAQEEEMRQNIEELMATQEEFNRMRQEAEDTQKRMEAEIVELKAKLRK